MKKLSTLEYQIITNIIRNGGTSKATSLSSEIGISESKLNDEVKKLIKKNYLKIELLSTPRCLRCKGKMRLIIDKLMCEQCDEIISQDDEHRILYSSCSLNFSSLIEDIIVLLSKQSINIQHGNCLNITGFHTIGKTRFGKKELVVVLAGGIPDLDQIYSLMGYGHTNETYVLLFHCGLKSEIHTLLMSEIIEPKLIIVDFQVLTNGKELIKTIKSVFKTEEKLQKSIENLEVITNEEISVPSLEGGVQFIEEIRSSSRKGRDSFEKYALLLLSHFGPTGAFKTKPFHPDGVLINPDGFWIVDAKSTDDFFKFPVREKDKAKRYIEKIENNAHRFSKHSFFGEIIITPELEPKNYKVIDALKEYFDKNPIKSNIIIIPLEGLLYLYEEIWKNMNYLHKYDSRKHIFMLFDISDKIASIEYTQNKILNASRNTHVRYITQETIKNYWKYVNDSRYVELGSDPNHHLELLSDVYHER